MRPHAPTAVPHNPPQRRPPSLRPSVRRWSVLFGLCAIPALVSCGTEATSGYMMYADGWGDGMQRFLPDQDTGVNVPDGGGADAGQLDATALQDGQVGLDAGQGNQLLFAMPDGNKDDYGGFCDELCKLSIHQNGLRKLYVKYTVGGKPAEGVIVKFALKDAASQMGTVLLENAVTDEAGIAYSEVKSHTDLGTFDVVAAVPDDPDVGGKLFELHVTSKAKGPLQVRLHYLGASNPFEYTWLKVQLAVQDPGGAPACKDIDYGESPATVGVDVVKTQWESPSNLQWDQPWTVTYKVFPGWVKDEVAKAGGPVHFTVLGIARKSSGGPVMAGGCVDTGATVTWNPQTASVEGDDVLVIVKDVPPRLKGTYDMTTHLDLLSILPDTVEFVFKSIFDILTDPIAGVLSMACKLGGSSLDSFCGLVFEDVKKPAIDNLKQPFGALIVKFLNAIIYGFLPDPVKKGLDTGADLGKILTNLEMGGTIKILKEPDNTGFLAKDFTEDEWTSITYKWSLGQSCSPKDPNCGKKTFPINAFQQKSIVGHFDLQRNALKSELEIFEHGLVVKWGALVNYIVQKQLLPAITSSGNDPNAPVIDSYEKLIKSLLADKQCLFKDTCCDDFGKAMEQKQSLVKASFLSGVCEAMVKMGTAYLEAQLNALDVDTSKGDSMVISTQQCPLFDINANQYIDRIGAPSDPCSWNMKLKIGGSAQTLDATFYATRQQ